MTDLIGKALLTLRCIEQDKAQCNRINSEIQTWQKDDFASRLHSLTPAVENAIISTLDAILGDEIASYYLYEVRNMEGGGKIIESDGVEWPIRDINDVERYARRAREGLRPNASIRSSTTWTSSSGRST